MDDYPSSSNVLTDSQLSSVVSYANDIETESQFTPSFYMSILDCSRHKVVEFNGTNGTVHGFINKHNYTNKIETCQFKVTVPEGMYVRAYSQMLSTERTPCTVRTVMLANNVFFWSMQKSFGYWVCHVGSPRMSRSPLLLMPGNVMYVKTHNVHTVPADFWLYFEGTREAIRESFVVVHGPGSRGHITLHGFDHGLRHAAGLNLSHTLHLPSAHVAFLSFQHFHLEMGCKSVYLELYSLSHQHEHTKLWRKCDVERIPAKVYNTSLVFKFISGFGVSRRGFKAFYSFHGLHEAPDMLSSGLFNCSRYYEMFRHHLDCNLRVECEHQEDETESCSFSSSHCGGAIHLQVNKTAAMQTVCTEIDKESFK